MDLIDEDGCCELFIESRCACFDLVSCLDMRKRMCFSAL